MQIRVPALALSLAIVVSTAGCSSDAPAVTEVYGDPASSTLEVAVDTCDADPVVKADESDTEVRLIVEAEESENRGDCQDSVQIELETPLGDREVIDAGSDEVMQVDPAE